MREKINQLIKYFTPVEMILWSISVAVIIITFVAFDRTSYANMFSSLIGVTSLIFIAKGNPVGQLLVIVFSVLYGIISYSYAYYGEMITYLFMTAPMALVALISWLRHPYGNNKAQVKINSITKQEVWFMLILSMVVTVAFYFLLKYFNTANLEISTVSIATSFIASYLTFRRSPFYAVAYAMNDVVLIVLWTLAAVDDISYFSITMCFAMFFANDIYGYINWTRMHKKQNSLTESPA